MLLTYKNEGDIIKKEGEKMSKALDRLKKGNEYFVEKEKPNGDFSKEARQANANGQKPFAVVLTCSDSRVIPEAIFNQGIGELFVIRVAGNVVGDSEKGSIEYAVDHLKTKTVVVLGHTNCGAIGATIKGETHGAVGKITKRISKAIGDEKQESIACKLIVLVGVKRIKRAFPAVEVVGGIYDIVSGKVEFLK